MKHLHFDSLGGASGDMILGSLVALGISTELLQSQLAALMPDPFELKAEPCESHHLQGIRLTVIIPHHEHHHHGHPAHRTFADIRGILSASSLSGAVKDRSLAVFQCLAQAEGRMHGISPEQVHFHEIGAVDSLVDIVGSCLALEQLGVTSVSCSPLPLGRGTIQCDHGVYPSPAPATLDILQGMPVEQTDLPFELVTPTGAALLKTWTNSTRAPTGSCPEKIGYAFGHHTFPDRPNLLRATLLETHFSRQEDECLVLECNLDDTTPEIAGVLAQKLLATGALDVFTSSIQMKKQRPGILLTVLAPPVLKETLLDLIFQESTTFGVREHLTRRTLLDRRIITVDTPYGPIPVKVGQWKDQDITRSPEMEACIAAAKARQVPVRLVFEAAQAAAHQPSLETPS